MKTIAIVSSPLQLAGFNASSVPKEKRFIIGNRGTQGDVSYDQSVLNDANFITDLEKRIAKEEVEIYLPNSLNLIYFYALSSPHIKRISFVDEGRLTKRFLQGGYAKPRAKHHDMMAFLMRMARFVPAPLRTFPYKLIAYSLRRWVVQSYEQDTLAYPYRTIERSEKSGTLLSHIEGNVPLDWVEQVDLTKGLEFPKNYQDRACLFIHPRHVHKTQWLEKLRDAFAPEEGALLVRATP